MASGEVENDNPVILPNPRSGHADPANFLLAHLGAYRKLLHLLTRSFIGRDQVELNGDLSICVLALTGSRNAL